MKDQMVLFCYAEGSGNAWEAICLNFDIAVQGTSELDVMAKLEAAVTDYFQYVKTLPADEQKDFLGRRVPLRIQFSLIGKTLLAWLLCRRDTKGRHSYSVPCTV
jgi:hypothetical protein